jgi:hypothetical protein
MDDVSVSFLLKYKGLVTLYRQRFIKLSCLEQILKLETEGNSPRPASGKFPKVR